MLKNKYGFPTFKSATGTSVMAKFNLADLTPTQQLFLVKCRIWGNIISGNVRNGAKYIQQKWVGDENARVYRYFNTKMVDPEYKTQKNRTKILKKKSNKYIRLKMKGVKLKMGRNGIKAEDLAMFNTSKAGGASPKSAAPKKAAAHK